MPYLIDANNLAGKLAILGRDDFDIYLTGILAQYVAIKNKKIILVFDGMGALANDYGENIKVIYALDNYGSETADDVMEDIIGKSINPRDYIIVSDDIDLRNRVEAIARRKGSKLKMISTTSYANEITNTIRYNSEVDESSDDLSDSEKRKINEELYNAWKT